MKNDGVKLSTKQSVKESGNYSLWVYGGSDEGRGIRVSLTLMISAAGTFAAIVVCVVGLSERELDDDFLVADLS